MTRAALALLFGCAACTSSVEATGGEPTRVANVTPPHGDTRDDHTAESGGASLAAITTPLCVTTGAATIGATIDQPAVRAIAKGSDGEAAALTFTFRGETPDARRLSSGDLRRQLGLKLRAENGCNLLYVMWRLDPEPMVYVSMKRNPGAQDHKACGADGYRKVKPRQAKPPPALVAGARHTLRAEITGDQLAVYIDDDRYWQGALPAAARELRGPAGLRSDNLAFELDGFAAAASSEDLGTAKCVAADHD